MASIRQRWHQRLSLTAVRRWLWVDWSVVIPGSGQAFAKLGRPLQQILLAGLTPAP